MFLLVNGFLHYRAIVLDWEVVGCTLIVFLAFCFFLELSGYQSLCVCLCDLTWKIGVASVAKVLTFGWYVNVLCEKWLKRAGSASSLL